MASATARSVRDILSSREGVLMPRHSPYRIVLSDEERAILISLARSYTLPYRKVTRARMVLLAAEGLRNDEIAAQLQCGRDVVSQRGTSTRSARNASKAGRRGAGLDDIRRGPRRARGRVRRRTSSRRRRRSRRRSRCCARRAARCGCAGRSRGWEPRDPNPTASAASWRTSISCNRLPEGSAPTSSTRLPAKPSTAAATLLRNHLAPAEAYGRGRVRRHPEPYAEGHGQRLVCTVSCIGSGHARSVTSFTLAACSARARCAAL